MAGGAVRGLGEIALRVGDLESMARFYEEVVGLELMRRFPNAVFFRIAEGFGGHTQILALFDRNAMPGYQGLDPKKTTLDHLAFEIPLEDYENEKRRIEEKGVSVRTQEFGWVHWRSLFFHDPEQNLVELVCYDESVRE